MATVKQTITWTAASDFDDATQVISPASPVIDTLNFRCDGYAHSHFSPNIFAKVSVQDCAGTWYEVMNQLVPSSGSTSSNGSDAFDFNNLSIALPEPMSIQSIRLHGSIVSFLYHGWSDSNDFIDLVLSCPVANPQTCCQIVLDHITQLVPPLAITEQGDNKPRQEVTVEADIEGVCPEKVIVCGVVKKKIIYDAVIVDPSTGAVTIREETKEDELPFQCAIDRDDANEGNAFQVVPDGAAVLCTLSEGYQNTGTYNGHPVAWKWHEKDVVKVCIRKAPLC